MKHLKLVLILLFNLGSFNFCISQSFTDLAGKHMTTVKGLNPYMTSKVLFGDLTQLKTGQQIELIGFEQNKVKVIFNGVTGFISQDFIDPSDISIAMKVGAEKAKKDAFLKAELNSKIGDSLSLLHSDSAFFIAKATKWSNNNQLLDKPNGNKLVTIEPEDVVLVRGFIDYNFLKVLHLATQRMGYVNSSNFDLSGKLKDSIYLTLAAVDRANQKIQKADLTKRFGAVNAQKILDKTIWIGMTSEMARIVLGEPEKNNRSVTARGKDEQWVYPNGKYYYFTNGILTAWQD